MGTLEKFDLDALRRAIYVERTNARLTQDDIAASLGCSRKWVSRFERGLSIPSFEIVIAYAAMFGIGIYMQMPKRDVELEHRSRHASKIG
nr:helix-turn-helix transcriptional regulator [Neorhizobium tomejilense]